MKSSHPQAWFRNVKKFSVSHDMDPSNGTALTVIRIYYNSFWQFPLKLKFRQSKIKDPSVELYKRHPEAEVVIERLKKVTGHETPPI